MVNWSKINLTWGTGAGGTSNVQGNIEGNLRSQGWEKCTFSQTNRHMRNSLGVKFAERVNGFNTHSNWLQAGASRSKRLPQEKHLSKRKRLEKSKRRKETRIENDEEKINLKTTWGLPVDLPWAEGCRRQWGRQSFLEFDWKESCLFCLSRLLSSWCDCAVLWYNLFGKDHTSWWWWLRRNWW